MSSKLWIENPPPLKQAFRGDGTNLASVPMQEGEEIGAELIDAATMGGLDDLGS